MIERIIIIASKVKSEKETIKENHWIQQFIT